MASSDVRRQPAVLLLVVVLGHSGNPKQGMYPLPSASASPKQISDFEAIALQCLNLHNIPHFDSSQQDHTRLATAESV